MPKRSVIVKALADLASQGRYNVDPTGAKNMNQLFDLVADVINSLEAEESTTVPAPKRPEADVVEIEETESE